MLKNLKRNNTEDLTFDVNRYSFWFGKPTGVYDGTEPFYVETPVGIEQTRLPAWEGYKRYQEGDSTLLLGMRKTDEGLKPVKYRLDYPPFKDTNNNVLLLGGSGSGKTWNFVVPNITSMNESYIITDIRGGLYEQLGQLLIDNGYKVLRYDLNHSFHSDTYNPFDYLYDDEGKPDNEKINEFINVFFENSYKLGRYGGDPFWNKTAQAFMIFLIYYILEFMPACERNFYTLFQLAQSAKFNENTINNVTELDECVANARIRKQDAKCFEYYDIFSITPAKTRNAIVISVGAELSVFAIDSYHYITSNTERNINLYDLGNTKTALFIITDNAASDPINTVLATMLIRHAQRCLSKAAESNGSKWIIVENENRHIIEGGFESNKIAQRRRKELPGSETLIVQKGNYSLPIPVRFIINSETLITFNADLFFGFASKHGINFTLGFQCIEQIQSLYNGLSPANLNCDICIYLGMTTQKTREYISHYIGSTIVSSSLTQDKVKFLMSADALGKMDNGKCIVMIRGLNPMLLDKIQPDSELISRNPLDKTWLDEHYPHICLPKVSDTRTPEKEITAEALAEFLGLSDKKKATKKDILHAVLDILEP
ncbi:type IV secretory system conjugative DNA transfer family protein [Butyrivibrio sp.]|uniref:type IV secretory system conjugative DNA transfer family protein n=1 Tax=Butyrivibrio sp. TaxID=28121 RepID=UPI0025C42795|nr:type IV secretory system conjugative DNA transfer family protein [Butyrivibrio sp.]MBQ7428373.1 type IV secretory system conjugative DNA transfer family protein [Butyrivibrio sp.]MBQ9303305.1 type IV secretory system conjugative DNA transfer family protein [Butyrivibrio sp.]